MKFKSLFLNISIFVILLSVLLKTRVSVCAPKGNAQATQIKSLGKDSFAFSQNITHQLIGSRIITQFTPKNSQGQNIDLNKLASNLGYDHFNWANYVEKDPYGIVSHAGQRLNTPYNDPPQGGYKYDSADQLPFYWDLVACDRCKSRHHFQNPRNSSQFELVFEDSPADYRLQPGEAVEFITNLVGVKQYDPEKQIAEWEILHTFRWKLVNIQQNVNQVMLIESSVALDKLPPLLLSTMQLDGAVLIIDNQSNLDYSN